MAGRDDDITINEAGFTMCGKKVNRSVECGSCGFKISETDNEKLPCPQCGSMNRKTNIGISSELNIYGGLGMKVKDPTKTGKSKTKLEAFQGYENSQTGMVKKERKIDRENNRYREIITDPQTGEILHKCDEPLSEHKGHGSDKMKKQCD